MVTRHGVPRRSLRRHGALFALADAQGTPPERELRRWTEGAHLSRDRARVRSRSCCASARNREAVSADEVVVAALAPPGAAPTKTDSGDSAKYELLFKRDQEMTEFIDRFEEVKEKEVRTHPALGG